MLSGPIGSIIRVLFSMSFFKVLSDKIINMKIKYTKNFLKYINLVRQNKVKFFVFDGLDGSGKGTLANLLCEHLVYNGYNVVFVELPDYSSPIGRLIKDMLKGSFNLVLNQTMALFALNRLEVLPAIILSALKLYAENNKDICVVFDRFVTSNILTIAYNLSLIHISEPTRH